MIRYERQDAVEGQPRAVKVITDDANAEMAALDEMTKECGFEIELPRDRDADENFSFVLPGGMVGEFGECVYDIDGGELEGLIDGWNREALAELEG